MVAEQHNSGDEIGGEDIILGPLTGIGGAWPIEPRPAGQPEHTPLRNRQDGVAVPHTPKPPVVSFDEIQGMDIPGITANNVRTPAPLEHEETDFPDEEFSAESYYELPDDLHSVPDPAEAESTEEEAAEPPTVFTKLPRDEQGNPVVNEGVGRMMADISQRKNAPPAVNATPARRVSSYDYRCLVDERTQQTSAEIQDRLRRVLDTKPAPAEIDDTVEIPAIKPVTPDATQTSPEAEVEVERPEAAGYQESGQHTNESSDNNATNQGEIMASRELTPVEWDAPQQTTQEPTQGKQETQETGLERRPTATEPVQIQEPVVPLRSDGRPQQKDVRNPQEAEHVSYFEAWAEIGRQGLYIEETGKARYPLIRTVELQEPHQLEKVPAWYNFKERPVVIENNSRLSEENEKIEAANRVASEENAYIGNENARRDEYNELALEDKQHAGEVAINHNDVTSEVTSSIRDIIGQQLPSRVPEAVYRTLVGFGATRGLGDFQRAGEEISSPDFSVGLAKGLNSGNQPAHLQSYATHFNYLTSHRKNTALEEAKRRSIEDGVRQVIVPTDMSEEARHAVVVESLEPLGIKPETTLRGQVLIDGIAFATAIVDGATAQKRIADQQRAAEDAALQGKTGDTVLKYEDVYASETGTHTPEEVEKLAANIIGYRYMPWVVDAGVGQGVDGIGELVATERGNNSDIVAYVQNGLRRYLVVAEPTLQSTVGAQTTKQVFNPTTGEYETIVVPAEEYYLRVDSVEINRNMEGKVLASMPEGGQAINPYTNTDGTRTIDNRQTDYDPMKSIKWALDPKRHGVRGVDITPGYTPNREAFELTEAGKKMQQMAIEAAIQRSLPAGSTEAEMTTDS